jgi:Fe-S cluster assembly iron-binding protein IscA
MKIFRRIAILTAVVLMLLPVLPGNTVLAAQGTVTVLAPSDVNPGSTNTAEIQIAADSGIVGFELLVKCDTSAIIFNSAKASNIESFNIITEKREDGLVYVAGYLNSMNPIAEGKLASITFKVVGALNTSTAITVSGDVYGWVTVGGDNNTPQSFKPVLIPSSFTPANVKISIIHKLTMAVNPNGGGTTTPAVGVYNYLDGSTVEVTAVSSAGYEFLRWDGDVVNPYSTVTSTSMKNSKTLIANFKPVEVKPTEPPPPVTTTPGIVTTTIVVTSIPVIVDTIPPFLESIRAINIGKDTAEILWSSNEIADSRVEYWASPNQSTDLDTNLVTTHAVKITGLNPLTLYHFKVFSRDIAGNIASSEEQSFTTAGVPATFTTGKWTSDVKEVSGIQKMAISFLLTNSGDATGTHAVDLLVNGKVIQNKSVTLDAGKSQRVEFSYEIATSGNYTVKIDETTLLVTVPKPFNYWPFVIGAGAFVLVLIIIFAITYGSSRKKITKMDLSLKYGPRQVNDNAVAKPARLEEVYDIPKQLASNTPTKSSVSQTSVNIGKYSVNITNQAIEKLKEAISLKTSNSMQAFRIISSAVNPRLVAMELGQFQSGDYIVDAMGRNVLFISPDAANNLDGATIGYQETVSGGEYYVSRKPAKTI